MRIYRDLFYSDEQISAKTLDVYLPDGQPRALFLYMHGGGLEKGSKERRADIISSYLCERGIGFISINYRMYPDAVFPDFIEDAAEAVAYAKRELPSLCGCDKLYVGGSSAGGYLSMMLCFDRRYLAAVGLDNSAVAGYFHDAGQPTSHYKVLERAGLDSRRVLIDERAPLYFVGLEEKYPPMHFVVSDNDMKGRYEQTMLMLATLDHFGYDGYSLSVMQGKHCAYVGRTDENGDSVLGRMICEFIDSTDGQD